MTPIESIPAVVADQLAFHWEHHVRNRLVGLTDAEYLWEPVPGWTLRARGEDPPDGARSIGAGEVTIDFAPIGLFAEVGGAVPPLTTIAWRMAHLSCGIFAERNHSHFDGPAVDYASFPYTLSAAEALAQLDEQVERWITGVRGLSTGDLLQPCGPAEGPFGDDPMLALVMHIHREAIHHAAEICLLRDLYAHQAA